MQLFAGLMLNRPGVILQTADVIMKPLVFTLQIEHLLMQVFGILPLVLECGQAVVAEHHGITHEEGEHRRSQCRRLAAVFVRPAPHNFYRAGPAVHR